MNYDNMTDFEINKAVAAIACSGHEPWSKEDSYNQRGDDNEIWLSMLGRFNPCNDPSDAWPIIVANGINIKFLGSDSDTGWTPYAEQDGFHSGYNKNPLRAAMIVYLMMQENEKSPG